MENINVPMSKEDLQAEILLLKERNRELEDELFHLKKVPVMGNDENEKKDCHIFYIFLYYFK